MFLKCEPAPDASQRFPRVSEGAQVRPRALCSVHFPVGDCVSCHFLMVLCITVSIFPKEKSQREPLCLFPGCPRAPAELRRGVEGGTAVSARAQGLDAGSWGSQEEQGGPRSLSSSPSDLT